MRVYRIYRRRRRDAAFTGEGARIAGARWNLPGTPMVYTCSTISLCLLEFFVHFDPTAADINSLNLEYRWADIPEALPCLEVRENDLPRNWKEVPWAHQTQELGTKWMTEGEHVIVSIPSVIVPMERNFLLNPAHPAFSKIRFGPPSAIELDPRLYSH
jgi:RES domain-containing protein